MDVTPTEPAAMQGDPAAQKPPAEQPHRPELDVSRIDAADAEPRPIDLFSGQRRKGFNVVIRRTALQAIHAHGRTDTSVEICGVLVGKLHSDYDGIYLLISAHIAGAKAASRETQVTFTADTWNDVQQRMETDFVGQKVVGWYHTHPGFGVFLSGMDFVHSG